MEDPLRCGPTLPPSQAALAERLVLSEEKHSSSAVPKLFW